jgi:hypothetical protein
MNPDGTKMYKNIFECFVKTLKDEGVTAFYKGFPLNYLRIGNFSLIHRFLECCYVFNF